MGSKAVQYITTKQCTIVHFTDIVRCNRDPRQCNTIQQSSARLVHCPDTARCKSDSRQCNMYKKGKCMGDALPGYRAVQSDPRHCKLEQQSSAPWCTSMTLYEEEPSIARGGEEQLDKLAMKLDMKTSHGSARRGRHARGRRPSSGGAGPVDRTPCRPIRSGPVSRLLGPARSNRPPRCVGGHYPISRKATGRNGAGPIPTGPPGPSPIDRIPDRTSSKKDPSSPVTWMEYEALRDYLQREPRVATETFDTEIQGVNLKVDESTTAINTVQTSMSTLQASIHNLTQAVGEIRTMVQQPQQPLDEDGSVNGDNAEVVAAQGVGRVFDKLTQLKQGVMTVDAYYMEMEMLMQRARVRESLEMTLQRFLNGLKFNIKGIVRHHSYTTMNELLHHAREAESQLTEEVQQRGRTAGRYTPRTPPSTASSSRATDVPSSSSKPASNVSNTKKPVPTASGTSSNMSTARNRDMACHTCGGKGHFKRDCPNRKVMVINEDNEYETGHDVDPDAPDDDDYDSDSFDAYPYEAQTIVVSQRVLNVQPSASKQR
ncbi:hypothetical protein QYE76_052525 [Lolium multiflorum]|uniref:CCHC-type domain-containing protein n=1 Tax=Lolium multiflorum TaxID=4521 RepID=A0AAD8SU33_LOLMU|nr:hypothetical protein QYE76_052525 [Lolium multiflorum]